MKALPVFFCLLPSLVLANKPLVVHEWGTFTVLQDEYGHAVAGVNINEESLPNFVHKLAPDLAPDSHELAPLIGLGYHQARRSKGIARYYHAARMRMETPIIYLHPPEDQPVRPMKVNVHFQGGWITEWYPEADVIAPGYQANHPELMRDLTPTTTGSLVWPEVHAVADTPPPPTDFPVWLAPRHTAAPMIRAGKEVEHYLFYRGVANLEAPLRVVRNADRLIIKTHSTTTCPIDDFSGLILWLVEVQPEGELRFRRVPVDGNRKQPLAALASTPAAFDQEPGEGYARLRQDMLTALVDRGLFQDEAEAMLNTWEASYFRTAGLRLFFTLPQSWTDQVLPLQVSGYETTEQVRAMIGRIELISDHQRALLGRIAQGPVSNREWSQAKFGELWNHRQALMTGEKSLEDFGLNPPDDYRAYMDLGRFRDALILHELARNPAKKVPESGEIQPAGPANLRQFADHYGLPL